MIDELESWEFYYGHTMDIVEARKIEVSRVTLVVHEQY